MTPPWETKCLITSYRLAMSWSLLNKRHSQHGTLTWWLLTPQPTSRSIFLTPPKGSVKKNRHSKLTQKAISTWRLIYEGFYPKPSLIHNYPTAIRIKFKLINHGQLWFFFTSQYLKHLSERDVTKIQGGHHNWLCNITPQTLKKLTFSWTLLFQNLK